MDCGAGGQRYRGEQAMAWYHRTCAVSWSAEETSLAGEVSPSITEVAALDWADEEKQGTQGKLCPRGCCKPASPMSIWGKAKLWWCEEYVSGATYISSLQAARLVMAEMQDFSNAVQGS